MGVFVIVGRVQPRREDLGVLWGSETREKCSYEQIFGQASSTHLIRRKFRKYLRPLVRADP
jgi:hypothetical protein